MISIRKRLFGAGLAVAVSAVAIAAYTTNLAYSDAKATADKGAPQAPPAMPVSVAAVEQRDVTIWDDYSGRLEAIDRVEVRSRVAGAIKAVHFREGALVKKDDLLITIDPDPYAAEVERAEAQVAAAEARLALARSDVDRGRQLWDSRTVSARDLDQRQNAHREAEANLRGAQAALRAAQLNLDYTQIKAPVSGRVGKLEITVGNLVAAGAGAPVLATLVSVDPIYASYSADEGAVTRALRALGDGSDPYLQVGRIPVRMITGSGDGTPVTGRLQLIDNQVDAGSGTVRVRAVFDNPNGVLLPGQFARLRMGQAASQPAVLVSERAVGTDQSKRFVMVIGEDNKAEYREIVLGPPTDGLRVVSKGLKAGERIVVNGLQRVRPGAVVAPKLVAMEAPSGVALADR